MDTQLIFAISMPLSLACLERMINHLVAVLPSHSFLIVDSEERNRPERPSMRS
jgi:hypothetical protein